MSIPEGVRHFSIANLLWITSAVAASLTLARLCEDGGDEAQESLSMVVYSAIHVLPLVWCALAIRRDWLSVSTTLLIAAAFRIPFVVTGTENGDWPMQVGFVVGVVWTVPLSLLLWRVCGFRLAGGEGRCDSLESQYNSDVLEPCGEGIDLGLGR